MQFLINKLDGIDRETIRLHHCSIIHTGIILVGFQGGNIQGLGRHLACLLGHMVNTCFEVFIGYLRQRKANTHILPLGGLELISVLIQHLDIEGVGRCDSDILIPDLIHRCVCLTLLVQQDTGDGQS